MPTLSEVPLETAFATDAYYTDQASVWRRLRNEAPVFWSDTFQAWIVSRYDDGAAILKDDVRFSSRRRLTKWVQQLPPETHAEVAGITDYLERGLFSADPPDHAPMRAALNKAFTPRIIDGLRPQIQAFVDDRIDACASIGRLDLVAGLADPLPLRIICELVGVPPEDESRYLAWTKQVFSMTGTGAPQLESIRAAQSGALEMDEYFKELFARRRREPRNDLLSTLLNMPDAERGMSDDDLRAIYGAFISAGHETTTSLIANGVIELLRHPDQTAAVGLEPTLAKSAVEEMLRWVTPIQRVLRVPFVDVELRGQTIAANDLVWILLAAANRDPEQFPDPERFNAGRQGNRHLAFALGPHFCLGAPLARQEAMIVIETLSQRLRGIRLAEQAIEIPPSWRLRTPLAAWIEFDSVAPRTSPRSA